MAQGTSSVPFDPSPFHPGPWLSRHDRLNSKYEKVRTFYEGVEGVESQWAFETERYTHGRANFASMCWSWGDSHRVGTANNGLRETCVYVCVRRPSQRHSPRHPITQAVYWSDISGNFHWCGTGAPAVKPEQRGGAGWGEMSIRERERSVGCCLSHLARSCSFMAYGGEHW